MFLRKKCASRRSASKITLCTTTNLVRIPHERGPVKLFAVSRNICKIYNKLKFRMDSSRLWFNELGAFSPSSCLVCSKTWNTCTNWISFDGKGRPLIGPVTIYLYLSWTFCLISAKFSDVISRSKYSDNFSVADSKSFWFASNINDWLFLRR